MCALCTAGLIITAAHTSLRVLLKNTGPARENIQTHYRTFIKLSGLLFFLFFFSATCAWYIRDGWHRGVSALLGSDGLCCRVPVMPQCDIKVAWVQGQVGFPTVLEKGLALISLL